MQETLISVIVPVYNVEKYLNRCLDSILNQEYKNIEVLLIDDGSKDNSGEICDQYSLKYPDIFKTYHKENGGLSSARNYGIERALGNYLSFIDSDDYIEKDMYSVMLDKIIKYNADISVCGRFNDYEGSNQVVVNFNVDTVTTFTNEEAIKRILTWDSLDISACDKLFRKNLFDNIRFPEGKNNEDICIIPSVIKKANKIVHVAKPFYHYFHRAGSISTTYNEKKIDDFYFSINQMIDFVKQNYPMIENELTYYVNKSYVSLLIIMVEINYKGEKRIEVEKYLKENFKNKYSYERMGKIFKVVYLLLKLNLYLPIKKVKKMLKR